MQEISQEKSPIKQKILLYLAEIGMSAADFYRKSGVTRGVLAQNNGISEDNISRFFKCFPEVNPSWLILGVGNMTLDQPLNQESQEQKQEISPTQEAPQFFSELLATIERQAKEIGRLEAELAETKKTRGASCRSCKHRFYCACRVIGFALIPFKFIHRDR